jgi:Protein of unknown function (DUF3455)
MRLTVPIEVLSVAAAVAMIGCAARNISPPKVPAALRPPANETVFLEANATGVQIYECLASIAAPGIFAWTFRAPEAVLTDAGGHVIGRHYAGPTWEARDGSRVLGQPEASDPGPDPMAVPWLLLRAKARSGAGLLAETQSIQRLRTSGGVAPVAACTAAQVHTSVRIPYSATYYFYRASR